MILKKTNIIIVLGFTQKKQQNFAAFLTKLINLPEGKVVFKLLKLSKDETIYLGMDKMNFLFKVDFEQIPVFKASVDRFRYLEIKIINAQYD